MRPAKNSCRVVTPCQCLMKSTRESLRLSEKKVSKNPYGSPIRAWSDPVFDPYKRVHFPEPVFFFGTSPFLPQGMGKWNAIFHTFLSKCSSCSQGVFSLVTEDNNTSTFCRWPFVKEKPNFCDQIFLFGSFFRSVTL